MEKNYGKSIVNSYLAFLQTTAQTAESSDFPLLSLLNFK